MSKVRVRYQTFEFGETDVHLRTLRDRNQSADDQTIAEGHGVPTAHWSLFGVVWESGEILAQLMHTKDIANARILEVGCGMALASLVLRYRNADITATDRHPEAGEFLRQNATLNGLALINFVRTGWSETLPSLGRFDLVIGSDVLYEEDNVDALVGFIEQHTQPQCEVVIVDPGRGLVARFTRRMLQLGYEHDSSLMAREEMATTLKGRVLRFSRQRLTC